MSNSPDRPRGFEPVGTLSGSPWSATVREYAVDTDNATAVFVGDAVTLAADGRVNPAAAGGVVLGVVTGVNYNRATAATEHPGYLPASTAGTVKVSVGPHVIYRVQEDTLSDPLELIDIGQNVNHIAGAGSTTTGRSAHELDSDSQASTTAGFRIIGKVDAPDNDISTSADTSWTEWLVTINEGHFTVIDDGGTTEGGVGI